MAGEACVGALEHYSRSRMADYEPRGCLFSAEELEPRLWHLFEQTPQGVVVLDPRGRILFANAAAATMLNAPLPSGQNAGEHSWARQLGISEILPRALGGELVSVEPRWLDRGEVGSSAAEAYPPVGVRLTAIGHPDGKGVSLLLDNVSQELQRRAEEDAARRQEEATRLWLEAIVDQMPGGVVVAEAPSGQIVLGNTQMERLLGHPLLKATQVVEYDRYGAEHPDGRPYSPEEHPLARAVAGERVEDTEVRYRRPDGELRILVANAGPVVDSGSRIIAAVTTFFDVTDRWRAEKNLQFLSESGAVLASSLEPERTIRNATDLAVPRLADVCIVFLREGDQLRRSHLAHTDPEVTRQFEEQWDPEGALVEPGHPAQKVVATGRSLHLPEIPDALLKWTARSPRHLEQLRALSIKSAFIVPLVGRSEILGALGFGMTERGRTFDGLAKQTTLELGRKAGMALHNAILYREAQKAIKSREEVLSVVSHDLRNPLGVVHLTADLLTHRSQGAGPDPQLEASGRKLRNAAQRMQRLIDDLLDLANIDSGRLQVWPEAVLATELLDELISTHMEQVTKLGRLLEVTAEPDVESLYLCCDRQRLLQVIGNLVDNALRYGPEGTAIRVRCERATNQARISVSDEGPGISHQEQVHIFERFWRKERSAGGTGLGLSIARGIVEAHGGRIWVESAPGAGARFVFTVPASKQPK